VVLVQILVGALADLEQAIGVAARNPEQLQQLAGPGGVGHQFLGFFGGGRRGKPAYPGKLIEVAEAKI